jgi:enoyl-[acyl-carrier protein] reductase/trans-2-enoyl-CoA reductase (NAD+)
MYRLFGDNLYGDSGSVDTNGRIRVDNFELQEDVQAEVAEIWDKVSTENLRETTDIDGYRREFFKLFGFGVAGVDYDADVEV